MSFNPNIPQASDDPSVSQGQILTNFTQLNNIFGTDHITYDAASDNGEHKQISLNAPLGADPGLADPKASVYTKTVNGDSELFYEKFNNAGAANQTRQMTNLIRTTVANTGTAGGNITSTDTPWGLRLIWGLTNSFSGTQTVIAPVGTTILNFQLTGNVSTGTRNPINGGTVAGTTLTIKTIDNVPVRYFIIGSY